MPGETLSELVVKIVADAETLKKGLAAAEKDVQGLGKSTERETKSIKDRFLEVGKTATIMGASITAAMGTAIRSFVKTGSELNDLSLKTGISVKSLAGLKYAAEQNGASLGTVEMAIRRTSSALVDAKDGLAETKRAFDRMGLSLQDLAGLNPEQQFLKIASAIAEIPDPMTKSATATDLFGRSGTEMLPMLSAGAASLQKMMEEGVRLTGWSDEAASSADALGDAFGSLTTSMTGIFNTIGASLAPALKNIADTLTNITGGVMAWIQAHPDLVKAISTATLAVGVFATGVGLASLAVKYLGTTTNLYFGGILLAIGGLVIGIMMLISWFNKAGGERQKLAEEHKKALEKQMAADEAYFANKRRQLETDYTNAIQKLKEEYGVYETTQLSKVDLAKQASEASKQALSDELKEARRINNEKISLLQKEYTERIRTLNAETDFRVQQIQDQIDAIDNQTEAEDKILREQRRTARLDELKAAIRSVKTEEDRLRAIEEIRAYEAQIERERLLERRQAEKDALFEQIVNIRTAADAEANRLQRELVAETEQIEKLQSLTQRRIELETEALNTALEFELERLAKELAEKEKTEEANLFFTLHRLGKEETALRNSYNTRLNETLEWVKKMNAETAKIESRTITITRQTVDETIVPPTPQSIPDILRKYPPMAAGGIVTQPTLAMIGESGAEAIVPLNEWGMPSITINITAKGNILTGRDLIRIIREELLRIKQRNFDSGL